MAAAAFLPAPIALMTVAAPVTASPPANTPSFMVVTVSSLTTMPPRSLYSRSGVALRSSGLGEVPSAMMTESQAISNSLPGTSIGRRRPFSSGSPSSIRMHLRPRTQPLSSARISTGLHSRWKLMPSSFACSYSSLRAGISSSPRRYTTVTSAPRRLAQRAASMATLPAPTTAVTWMGISGVS